MAVRFPATVTSRLRPPLVIVLGSATEAADLVEAAGTEDVVCYQMDLYAADRLREELAARDLTGKVVTAPDLWDLPADFRTAVHPAPKGGERELKIDMVEQAFHVLRPRGALIVLSAFREAQLFPGLMKKVFGRVHADTGGAGAVFWGHRDGDRPRRRHEVTFQVRAARGPPLRFLSRPGVFAYGRFDEGARALAEVMEVGPGDKVLDVGCGCGTNGVLAGRLGGAGGHVTFLDSNVRAVALAEHNARANGLAAFEAVASGTVEGPAPASFDVALANPPYFAQAAVAQLFINRSRVLLRPGGRFYLVTKQPQQVGPLVEQAFGPADEFGRRGYTIFRAAARDKARRR